MMFFALVREPRRVYLRTLAAVKRPKPVKVTTAIFARRLAQSIRASLKAAG